MFLFNKKSKSIEQSVQETKKVKEDYSKQKELINDFIFILEHIQILELDITNNVDI